MEAERRQLLWQAMLDSAVDGVVTASGVLKAAKDPANILHGEYNWDKDAAAEAHWLQRTRELIRICAPTVEYIKVENTAPIVRDVVYVHDPRVGPRVQAYVSTTDLAREGEAALGAVLLELRAVSSAVSRLARVAHALGIDCPTEELEAAVASLRQRLELVEKVEA
jgi:hypothetical protein